MASYKVNVQEDKLDKGNIAVRVLINALLNYHNRRLRLLAAWALGRIGDAYAIEPLIFTLSQNDILLRGVAGNALVKIGEPVIVPLLGSLNGVDNETWLQAGAVLVRIGEPAVEPLIDALQDSRETVKMLAAGTLGWLGDERAVRPLVEMLYREHDLTRTLAAMSLVRIGEPAVKPLIETLYGDNEHVWREASNALKLIGAAAIEPLIETLKEGYEQVRILTVIILGRAGDKRAVRPLMELLDDPHVEVREAAAEALVRIERITAPTGD